MDKWEAHTEDGGRRIDDCIQLGRIIWRQIEQIDCTTGRIESMTTYRNDEKCNGQRLVAASVRGEH